MKKQKTKRAATARPQKSVKTKFIRVLDDWFATTITHLDSKKSGYVVEYVMSPKKNIYRRASAWENPHIVIDSPLLPAEHHVRLMRVKDRKIKKEVLRALRRNRSR